MASGAKQMVSNLAQKVADSTFRFDAWRNLLTGLGTLSRDKLESTEYSAPTQLSDSYLTNLYNGDDMAARICDTIPEEMLRKGFGVRIDDDKEKGFKTEDISSIQSDIMKMILDLEVTTKFIEAMTWGRLYGGGIILIGARDGTDPERMFEPLNEKNIQTIDGLNVIDRQNVTVATWYDDPTQPNYGEPRTYAINTAATGSANSPHIEVHESRLIVFLGQKVTIQRRRDLDGWSDSVLQRVHSVLMQFGVGWQAVAHMFTDASQAIFRMQGLMKALASEATGSITARMTFMDINRSVARAIVIDAENESFERQPYDFGNVDSVLQMFILRLSAAARMPATILMGQSPAGENATGDADFRWFYDTIDTRRENELKPKLTRIVELIMSAQDGPTKGEVLKNWSLIFPSLWQPTQKEESEIRKNQAETDKTYIEQGVLLPEEITLSRFPASGYSSETTVDLELRAEELAAKKERALEELNNPDPEPEPQLPPPVPPDPDPNKPLPPPTPGQVEP